MEKTEPMTEKECFVTLAQTGRFTITDLCSDFGICRKTEHEYLPRQETDGRVGLGERSRRPKSCPSATAEEDGTGIEGASQAPEVGCKKDS